MHRDAPQPRQEGTATGGTTPDRPRREGPATAGTAPDGSQHDPTTPGLTTPDGSQHDPTTPDDTRRRPGGNAGAVNDEGRHETPVEKLDRNWNEILQELRVTQTGIQILTGFLLTVPFQARFAELTADQREIYLVLVGLAATTTALLVAPVSLHRVLFRRHAKSVLVSGADRLMRVGLVFLALTVSGVVLLVFDVVVGRGVAVVAASAILTLLVGAWFVLPTVMARRVPDQDAPVG